MWLTWPTGTAPTALVRAARRGGAVVVDGLEVLVRQGALSFELWTGVDAPIAAMRSAVGQRDRRPRGAGVSPEPPKLRAVSSAAEAVALEATAGGGRVPSRHHLAVAAGRTAPLSQ